jgi:uncharacterized protein YgbK (DUF1537 family)
VAHLAIVADDLTGAADTGACFADAGYATVIPLVEGPFPGADVLVLSTESRDMDRDAAARSVGDIVARLWSGPGDVRPRWLYKKIDSALRGHPRDELLAAMKACGATRALVSPALPAEGRTTVGGRQYVGGIPLEESAFGGKHTSSDLIATFANDRGLPVRLLDLPTLRNRPDAAICMLEAESPGIMVADAETDGDLTILSQLAVTTQQRTFSGAAGFARQLAPVLPLPPSTRASLPIKHSGGPILVVAGSQHEATARQIAAFGQTGAPVVRLTQSHIDDPAGDASEVISSVAAALSSSQSTVVTTVGLAPSALGARAIAARLAQIAAAPAIRNQVGGMVLTGGDVAAAVCAALGATALWLGGEIYAGQPWGALASGDVPGLPVATKAGSFGRDDALLTCVAYLSGPLQAPRAASSRSR